MTTWCVVLDEAKAKWFAEIINQEEALERSGIYTGTKVERVVVERWVGETQEEDA